MSQIYNSLVKAENEKRRASNEKPLSQIFEPEKAKVERDVVINFPQEKMETHKPAGGSGEKEYLDEQSTRSTIAIFCQIGK